MDRKYCRSDYDKFRATLLANEGPSTSTAPEKTWILTNIADGFQEDCDMFIAEFKKKQSIRFNSFYDLWKELKFELIYCGRPSIPELLEFAEEATLIASKYLFSPNKDDDYQTCIAGLYLVYCLHHAHPVAKKTSIRVIPSSIFVLKDLHTYALNCGHVDVLYVLCSLLKDGVFKFVAKRRDYGPEKSYRKYDNDFSIIASDNLEDAEFEGLDNLIDTDNCVLNELDAAMEEYHNAKCDLPGAIGNVPPKNLDYVLKDFTKQLKRSVQDLICTEYEGMPNRGAKYLKPNPKGSRPHTDKTKIKNEKPSSLSIALMDECFQSTNYTSSESEHEYMDDLNVENANINMPKIV